MIPEAKTKAITMKLISAFVYAYIKHRFSHDMAHSLISKERKTAKQHGQFFALFHVLLCFYYFAGTI